MNKIINLLLTSIAMALLAFGCASPNVNPASPRPHVGYVDLHTDFSGELSWSVRQFDGREYKKVFYDFDPLDGRILRLAFPPGSHRLRVTFLDRVVTQPAELDVQVHEGKITPVRITVTQSGTTSVLTKQTSAGGTLYGRYGRRTKISSSEGSMYTVTATLDAALDYSMKQQMPYAQ